MIIGSIKLKEEGGVIDKNLRGDAATREKIVYEDGSANSSLEYVRNKGLIKKGSVTQFNQIKGLVVFST